MFKLKLLAEIGVDEYEKLAQLAFGIEKIAEFEAVEMIKEYKRKLKEL